jgi:hypothetical protein
MPYPPPPPPAAPIGRGKRNGPLLLIGAAAVLAILYAALHRGSDTLGGDAPTVEPEKPASVKTKMPDWVPIYPGSILASDVTITRTPSEIYYAADYSTKASCNTAIFWYLDTLRSLGFLYGGRDVQTSRACDYDDNSPDAANGNAGQVSADSPDRHRTLRVNWYQRALPQGDTEKVMNIIHLNAVERNHGAAPETLTGRAQPRIPDWAPIYPGATPELSGVQQSSNGTIIRFQFPTNDTCATVIDWYQRTLAAAAFRTFGRADDHSRPNGCDSRVSAESGARLINIHAVTYTYNVHVEVETVQK